MHSDEEAQHDARDTHDDNHSRRYRLRQQGHGREEGRSGRKTDRVWVTLPSGKRERLTGTPATDTRKAAEHAERLHVLRVMNPGLVVVPEVIEAPAPPRKEVPTLAEFAEEFLREQTGAVSEQPARRAVIDPGVRGTGRSTSCW